MKTAAIEITTDDGAKIAAYRGLSLEMIERVVRFLDYTIGTAKVIGDLKRSAEAVAMLVDGALVGRRKR